MPPTARTRTTFVSEQSGGRVGMPYGTLKVLVHSEGYRGKEQTDRSVNVPTRLGFPNQHAPMRGEGQLGAGLFSH